MTDSQWERPTDIAEAGFMVLNRDGKTHWDGEVHSDLDRARRELCDAESNPSEYGTGWYIAELREVS